MGIPININSLINRDVGGGYLVIGVDHPGFARSITNDDIVRHSIRGRVCRNRRIGDFLKELRLIEGLNTGFPNEYAAPKTNGSPDLSFEMDEMRSHLSAAIPVHPHFLPRGDAGRTRYEERISVALSAGDLTPTELTHAMGHKGISGKPSACVERMLGEGKPERVASGRTTKQRVVR